MSTSIGKTSKSFLIKILVGIIILPFVFWGMGDVFRGGNQNVIATIDSEKVSTQEFVKYLNQLNLNQSQIKNIQSSNLLEQILTDYIGKKVMELEIEKKSILVSDNSLRNIIKNDKLFSKNNEFSRTEYEKFLLKSGITAPSFEKNIAKQESRRQYLSFLSGGITVPFILIENEFRKENQTKTIKFIDLNNFYSQKKPSEEEKKEIYNNNKGSFQKEFKSIQYAEIKPESISGNKEYDENFFKQLDILENNVLDGMTFESVSEKNNLKVFSIEDIDKFMNFKKKTETKQISKDLFNKIFNIKKTKAPEIIKIDNKFYIAEIKSLKREERDLNDPEVIKVIDARVNFKNKIDLNTSIIKDISMGGFDLSKFENFASINNLQIKDYKISNIKQNDIFSENFIKRIFLTKDGDVDLITDNTLTKNYLIIAVKTEYKKLKKDSNLYEQYEAKSRLNLINKIYKIYDENLNNKYKVELNQRTIDRVKNSF